MTHSSSFSSSKKPLFSKRDGGSRQFDNRAGCAKTWRHPSSPTKNGYGTVTDSNGDCYRGHFVNGLKSGRGTLIFANGNVYEGDFRNNRMWGIGTLKYINGDKYHGDFVDGLKSGRGKYTTKKGNIYEGDFVEDSRTGRGKLTSIDGSLYEGDFVAGEMSGRGKFTWANENVYEGDFVNGKMTGRGTYTWANGEVYEGDFVNGKQEGRGKITDYHGVCYEGKFHNDHFQGDVSNLGDLTFLQLLCGIPFPDDGAKYEYALTIMSAFLIANGYSELGEALKLACRTYQSGKDSLDTICRKIKGKQSQLLLYGCSYHAMGLNINCNPNSDYALFEIFNSDAEDLEEFHEKNGSKYSTMLTEEIPIKNITRQKVSRIIDCEKFDHADAAYQAIKSIHGAKTINTADLPSPAWQTPQKEFANNCTVEWINAFLRNKMTKDEYDGMRLKLFGVCLNQAKKKEKNDELDECIGILEKKMEKRVNRLAVSSVKLTGPVSGRKRKHLVQE